VGFSFCSAGLHHDAGGSLLLWGNGEKEKYSFHSDAMLYHRVPDQFAVGSVWILAVIRARHGAWYYRELRMGGP